MRTLFAGLAVVAGLFLYVWLRPISLEISPPVMADTISDTIDDLNRHSTKKFPERQKYSADVKVLLNTGDAHGSAVHIGNGYFLTAAHVANANLGRFDIQLSDGSIRKAEVLWSNKDYDIALIRADGRDIEAANLSCRVADVGEQIMVKGNPVILDNISAWGRIAGEERKLGSWKSVLVVDAQIIPGQSGGAVYDYKHDLIGIEVGLVMLPLPTFSTTATGYGLVVSGKSVCELLARV